MEKMKFMKHVVLAPAFPCNTVVFVEEWVDKYADWFRNNTAYCSVFLENTESNAHLDICLWMEKRFDNPERSLKNLNAKFCAQNIATQPNLFYRKMPCNEDDILYVTGYNHKDNRCVYSNLPGEFVSRAKEYYAENEKLKRVRKFQNTNPLNVKNIVCYLLERSEDLSVKCPMTLTNRMLHEGFSFVALSKKNMRKAVLEFKFRKKIITQFETEEMNMENGCYHMESFWDSDLKCAKAMEYLDKDEWSDETKMINLNILFFKK